MLFGLNWVVESLIISQGFANMTNILIGDEEEIKANPTLVDNDGRSGLGVLHSRVSGPLSCLRLSTGTLNASRQ